MKSEFCITFSLTFGSRSSHSTSPGINPFATFFSLFSPSISISLSRNSNCRFSRYSRSSLFCGLDSSALCRPRTILALAYKSSAPIYSKLSTSIVRLPALSTVPNPLFPPLNILLINFLSSSTSPPFPLIALLACFDISVTSTALLSTLPLGTRLGPTLVVTPSTNFLATSDSIFSLVFVISFISLSTVITNSLLLFTTFIPLFSYCFGSGSFSNSTTLSSRSSTSFCFLASTLYSAFCDIFLIQSTAPATSLFFSKLSILVCALTNSSLPITSSIFNITAALNASTFSGSLPAPRSVATSFN